MVNGFDRDLDGSTLGDRPNIGNPKAPVNTRGLAVATSVSVGLQNPTLVTSTNNGCVTANDASLRSGRHLSAHQPAHRLQKC